MRANEACQIILSGVPQSSGDLPTDLMMRKQACQKATFLLKMEPHVRVASCCQSFANVRRHGGICSGIYKQSCLFSRRFVKPMSLTICQIWCWKTLLPNYSNLTTSMEQIDFSKRINRVMFSRSIYIEFNQAHLLQIGSKCPTHSIHWTTTV